MLGLSADARQAGMVTTGRAPMNEWWAALGRGRAMWAGLVFRSFGNGLALVPAGDYSVNRLWNRH